MEAILSMLGSVLGGGSTGLLGSLFIRWFDNKDRKNQRDHEHKMAQLTQEEIRLEGEYNLRLQAAEHESAQLEAEIESDIRDADAFQASLSMDKATYGKHILGRIVDFVRGMMRPVITAWMVYQLYQISQMLGGLQTIKTFTATQQHELFFTVVNAILYLASMTVGWWFGSRSSSPPRS